METNPRRDDETLLTADELAEAFGKHINTIRNWIRAYRIPGYRIAAKGRTAHYKLGDVRRAVNEPTPLPAAKKAVAA